MNKLTWFFASMYLSCCAVALAPAAQELFDAPPKPTPAASDWDFVEHTNYEDSVVKITVGQKFAAAEHAVLGFGGGTGFIASRQNGFCYIMTCAHVVDKGTVFTAFSHNNKKHKCELVFVHWKADIAVLRCKESDNLGQALPLCPEDEYPKAGTAVEAIGWGYSAKTKPRHWTVDLIVGSSAEGGSYCNGPFQWGDSGGPLIHNGKIIGMMTQGQCVYNGVKSKCVGPGEGCSRNLMEPAYHQIKFHLSDF